MERLEHERVDDVPVILGMAQHMNLPTLLEEQLGSHGNHQGITNGWLATIWLAYILSEHDHRKSTVQAWVERHQRTLERSSGLTLRSGECNDDRLGIVLRRLADTACWQALEAALWHQTLEVYTVDIDQVRLDSTTTYGYHARHEDGLMQLGHSKDHRPDLPQVKLMAAVGLPCRQVLAADVVPGNTADDPLYAPLYRRVQQTLGRSGLLYTGDSKMAAVATRAAIAAHDDYYLVPLPLVGETREHLTTWVAQAMQQGTEAYEVVREQTLDEQRWEERVQVLRSPTIAQRQTQDYADRLAQATKALWALTPAPGRGKRQIRDETTLQTAITQVLETYEIPEALQVTWQREETAVTHFVGRGRGSAQRAQHIEIVIRYQITAVHRVETVIAEQQVLFGWRPFVTNAPPTVLPPEMIAATYGAGWGQEDLFHQLKSRPLGIHPLFVQTDDQIAGLTHLLLLALRIMMLIEWQVQTALATLNTTLTGLYPEAPKRATNHPSARRILGAFARAELTLIRLPDHTWYMDSLSPLLHLLLTCLRLDPALYSCLAA